MMWHWKESNGAGAPALEAARSAVLNGAVYRGRTLSGYLELFKSRPAAERAEICAELSFFGSDAGAGKSSR